MVMKPDAIESTGSGSPRSMTLSLANAMHCRTYPCTEFTCEGGHRVKAGVGQCACSDTLGGCGGGKVCGGGGPETPQHMYLKVIATTRRSF